MCIRDRNKHYSYHFLTTFFWVHTVVTQSTSHSNLTSICYRYKNFCTQQSKCTVRRANWKRNNVRKQPHIICTLFSSAQGSNQHARGLRLWELVCSARICIFIYMYILCMDESVMPRNFWACLKILLLRCTEWRGMSDEQGAHTHTHTHTHTVTHIHTEQMAYYNTLLPACFLSRGHDPEDTHSKSLPQSLSMNVHERDVWFCRAFIRSKYNKALPLDETLQLHVSITCMSAFHNQCCISSITHNLDHMFLKQVLPFLLPSRAHHLSWTWWQCRQLCSPRSGSGRRPALC